MLPPERPQDVRGRLVDRPYALDGDHVVVLAQRGEAAEHLLAHCLDVLGPEASHATGQPHRLEKSTLLPAADRVLVDAERLSALPDLHQLCHRELLSPP